MQAQLLELVGEHLMIARVLGGALEDKGQCRQNSLAVDLLVVGQMLGDLIELSVEKRGKNWNNLSQMNWKVRKREDLWIRTLEAL